MHNEIQTLVPGLQSLVFPGSPVGWVFPDDPGIPTTLAPTRYNNFAPRIGLAYSPSVESGFWRKVVGEPGRSSVRAAFGRFFSTFEGATNFNEIGDAPFGNYYGSLVPPQYVTPFVDRGTGNGERDGSGAGRSQQRAIIHLVERDRIAGREPGDTSHLPPFTNLDGPGMR